MQAFRLLDEDGTGSISREALAAWSKDALGTAHVHAHVHIHGPRAHAPAALPEAVLRGACPSSQGGRSHTIPLRHTMPLCAIRRNPMQALREKLTQKGFHRMTGQVPGGR